MLWKILDADHVTNEDPHKEFGEKDSLIVFLLDMSEGAFPEPEHPIFPIVSMIIRVTEKVP